MKTLKIRKLKYLTFLFGISTLISLVVVGTDLFNLKNLLILITSFGGFITLILLNIILIFNKE